MNDNWEDKFAAYDIGLPKSNGTSSNDATDIVSEVAPPIFLQDVSGIPTGSSVFSFSQTEQAKWIGGGMFGLEGGAAATVVMLAVIVILLLIPARKYETEE